MQKQHSSVNIWVSQDNLIFRQKLHSSANIWAAQDNLIFGMQNSGTIPLHGSP